MVRTNLIARGACFSDAMPYQQRSTSYLEASTFVYPWRPTRISIVKREKECPDISRFSNLPLELQARIWELAAQEPRIVAVRSISVHMTPHGLRAPIPPLLHTCSLSRHIALKAYSLILGYAGSTNHSTWKGIPVPTYRLEPRIYFNFASDILYFPKGWNQTVDASYSCFNRLLPLLNTEDTQKVERIAFDLDVSICCPRSSSRHGLCLGPWKGVTTLYLAMRGQQESGETAAEVMGGDKVQSTEFIFDKLSMEQRKQFLELYRDNPAWEEVSEDLTDEEAFGFITEEETGRAYGLSSTFRQSASLPVGFCGNVSPVLVLGM